MAKLKTHNIKLPDEVSETAGIDAHKIMRGIKSDKPYYFTSFISHYNTCPKKYKLSLKHKIETSEAMRDGLLFEGFVFGFPDEKTKKKLIGKKHEKTLKLIQTKAESIKGLLHLDTAVTFQNISYENDLYGIGGQKDYQGEVLYNGLYIYCNADLKFTNDIEKYWNYKANKIDYLQALTYTYIDFKNTGEMLPFIFIVVENNNFLKPLYKLIKLNFKESDFILLESLLAEIHADVFYTPNPQPGACYYPFGRCDFMEHCQEGRAFLAQNIEIDFERLI